MGQHKPSKCGDWRVWFEFCRCAGCTVRAKTEGKEVRDRGSTTAMRDRRARVAVIGLLMLIPALMAGMSPRTTSVREALMPVLATEIVLLAGLSGAARERKRLLTERAMPARRPVPSAPHAGRVLSLSQALVDD